MPALRIWRSCGETDGHDSYDVMHDCTGVQLKWGLRMLKNGVCADLRPDLKRPTPFLVEQPDSEVRVSALLSNALTKVTTIDDSSVSAEGPYAQFYLTSH